MVIKFGKWVAKHKIFIIIAAVLLLIPATIGYISTRINYDVLSYLPKSLETVSGQDTMVDEFGMGAFSMIVVEDMDNKDVVALKEKLKKVNHVEKILWYVMHWYQRTKGNASGRSAGSICLMEMLP